MKKLAVGCLAVFAVLFLAGGALLWWYVGRPAAAAFGAVQELGRIEEIRSGVRDDAPYDAPEDGVLTASQVDRYLVVQSSVRERLGDRLDTLRGRYEELEAREGEPGPAEIARAWSDTTGLLVEAARAQVDALNEQGFSAEEYAWVRSRVLRAAGYAAAGYDLTALAAGVDGEAAASPAPDPNAPVPPENVELVAPHRDVLERTLPIAWFGL